MKLNLPILALAGILGFAPAIYAQSETDQPTAEQVKQETQELLAALKSYAAEKSDQAVASAESAMDTFDQRINALEERLDQNWDSMSESARENARKTLQTLREQRTKVAEWYGGMRVAGAEAWNEVKQGFSDAYQRLSDTWQESEEEIPSEN